MYLKSDIKKTKNGKMKNLLMIHDVEVFERGQYFSFVCFIVQYIGTSFFTKMNNKNTVSYKDHGNISRCRNPEYKKCSGDNFDASLFTVWKVGGCTKVYEGKLFFPPPFCKYQSVFIIVV